LGKTFDGRIGLGSPLETICYSLSGFADGCVLILKRGQDQIEDVVVCESRATDEKDSEVGHLSVAGRTDG